MTLGARSLSIGLFAAAASLAALVIAVGLNWLALIEVLPLLLLIAAFMTAFAQTGFSPLTAGIVTVSLLAQPGIAAALARLDGPVWLSLSVFAVTASAALCVSRRSLRFIIALGAGLAVFEAIDPIGIFFVAALIPVLVALPQMRANGYQAVALAMLVMFVPVVSAVLLWQIGQAHPLPPLVSILLALGIPVHASPGTAVSPFVLIAAGVGLIPAFVAAVVPARTGAALLAAMLALLVVACFAAEAFLGTHRQLVWLQAALLPIAVVALAAANAGGRRENIAVGASIVGLAASWAVWSLG